MWFVHIVGERFLFGEMRAIFIVVLLQTRSWRRVCSCLVIRFLFGYCDYWFGGYGLMAYGIAMVCRVGEFVSGTLNEDVP